MSAPAVTEQEKLVAPPPAPEPTDGTTTAELEGADPLEDEYEYAGASP